MSGAVLGTRKLATSKTNKQKKKTKKKIIVLVEVYSRSKRQKINQTLRKILIY